MLLKWLFTILAIIWLIQALRPLLGARQSTHLREKPPPKNERRNDDDDKDKGEYIDYEEIK